MLALAVSESAVIIEIIHQSRRHIIICSARLRVIHHIDRHTAMQHQLSHSCAALLACKTVGMKPVGIIWNHGIPIIVGTAEIGSQRVAIQNCRAVSVRTCATLGPLMHKHHLGHGSSNTAGWRTLPHCIFGAKVIEGRILVPHHISLIVGNRRNGGPLTVVIGICIIRTGSILQNRDKRRWSRAYIKLTIVGITYHGIAQSHHEALASIGEIVHT